MSIRELLKLHEVELGAAASSARIVRDYQAGARPSSALVR
jgi:hypothetical protein